MDEVDPNQSSPQAPIAEESVPTSVRETSTLKEEARIGRKREREGSIEPSVDQEPSASTLTSDSAAVTGSPSVALPKKKNRIVSSSSTSSDQDERNGGNLKEVQKGVKEMGVDELKKQSEEAKPIATPADEPPAPAEVFSLTDTETTPQKTTIVVPTETKVSEAKTEMKGNSVEPEEIATTVAEEAEEPESSLPQTAVAGEDGLSDATEKVLKRKLNRTGSSLPGDSPLEGAETKKVKEEVGSASSSPSPSSTPGSAPVPTVPKPKPIGSFGFSSFASTSSPFTKPKPVTPSSPSLTPSISTVPSTSPTPSTATPSGKPAGASISTASTTYSSFTSATSASPFTSGSRHTSSPSPFAGSTAFSSFSSAPSAFAKQDNSSNVFKRTTPESSAFNAEPHSAEPVAGPSTFEPVMDEATTVEVQEQDVITGEEDESTVHQVRAKLHVMEKNGGWKERGTGLLKLNIKKEDAKKARLVMRSEAVFRLILNVAVFAGMTCEKQDKFVRVIAIEEGTMVHLAIKVGTAKSAEDLYNNILSLIPLDSSSPSPEPPKYLNYAMKPDSEGV